ncbi:hypothetical protein NDU88_005453 [Pleurodeles waltl]|uniref:Uncharacterized protein n=1 Tax=Pleurodeles waltl TaxID=8319 RepID=A0AAV7SLR3_PLEWA|nr:hypothetical protein NDU88_005453 [Pleurodeles waltl]
MGQSGARREKDYSDQQPKAGLPASADTQIRLPFKHSHSPAVWDTWKQSEGLEQGRAQEGLQRPKAQGWSATFALSHNMGRARACTLVKTGPRVGPSVPIRGRTWLGHPSWPCILSTPCHVLERFER